MTVEQKQKLLVDYMVEVVRYYDLKTEEFIMKLPLIHKRVFSKLTDEEYKEYREWFGENVPRDLYDRYIDHIANTDLDAPRETIYEYMRGFDNEQ